MERLITTQQPDIILLQETLVDSTKVSSTLATLLLGWQFVGIDVVGRSVGRAMGWCIRIIKLLNSWELNSCLKIYIFVEGLGKEFRILNVYCPYLDKTPFWESLLRLKILKDENFILGGGLNFSLGAT